MSREDAALLSVICCMYVINNPSGVKHGWFNVSKPSLDMYFNISLDI